MYVGFAASTEGSTELHFIENWSFQTFGFSPVRPRSNHSPHNVSDNSVLCSSLFRILAINIITARSQSWNYWSSFLVLFFVAVDFFSESEVFGLSYVEKNLKAELPLIRYNIAVGLASVLTYLHQECEQQVIHRDIKASNVMLDGSYTQGLAIFWAGKTYGS
ncbi:hypothetical protein HAX54_030499 [Datura stramonium]|uniref:Protein kinase domain-containing protein n=1 Tax=Datura stramonium TaxID=4076 RepID=A0ABS8SB04_DATST|nr:hypothetical protein [Datura stramonium]